MRHLTTLVGLFLLMTSALSAFDRPVVWQTDLTTAYTQALREHKPLVIFFADRWDHQGEVCHSEKLEREVLTTDALSRYAGKAVFVKVFHDQNEDVKVLIEKLEVNGFPTVSVIDAQADALNEVGRVVGSLPVTKWMGQFEELMVAWEWKHTFPARPVPPTEKQEPSDEGDDKP